MTIKALWRAVQHKLPAHGLIHNSNRGRTKMGLNVLATTAACLLTYQLFVRYTLIGVLLNGRRQPIAAAPVLAVEQP